MRQQTRSDSRCCCPSQKSQPLPPLLPLPPLRLLPGCLLASTKKTNAHPHRLGLIASIGNAQSAATNARSCLAAGQPSFAAASATAGAPKKDAGMVEVVAKAYMEEAFSAPKVSAAITGSNVHMDALPA